MKWVCADERSVNSTFRHFAMNSVGVMRSHCRGRLPLRPRMAGECRIRRVVGVFSADPAVGNLLRLQAYTAVRRQQERTMSRAAVDVRPDAFSSHVDQRSAARRAIHWEAGIGHERTILYRTMRLRTLLVGRPWLVGLLLLVWCMVVMESINWLFAFRAFRLGSAAFLGCGPSVSGWNNVPIARSAVKLRQCRRQRRLDS